MPAIIAHTISVFCPRYYRARLDNGWLMMPTDTNGEGSSLIHTLHDLWANANRPNCKHGFRPSPIIHHVNGWDSFCVAYIAHEGDDRITSYLTDACLAWRYDDESTPVRILHTSMDTDYDHDPPALTPGDTPGHLWHCPNDNQVLLTMNGTCPLCGADPQG